MFGGEEIAKNREMIKKLEGKVATLKTYCEVLSKEQEEMYNAIIKGLKLELSEITSINKEFCEAKDKRRKAFGAIRGMKDEMS